MDPSQLLSAIGGGTSVAGVLFYFVRYLQNQITARDAIIAAKDVQILDLSHGTQRVLEEQLAALRNLHS